MEPRLVVFGLCWVTTVFSVPILNDNISNKLEDLDDVEVIDDDFTTRSLERLSSAATCLVAGIEYTHGQQINRIDPCEFCLCLDGEMFCWWQDCPPATDGPCKDQGPFSQCDNIIATKAPSPSKVNLPTQRNSTENISTSKGAGIHQDNINLASGGKMSSTTKSETSTKYVESSSSTSESSTPLLTSAPKLCVVMGVQYRIGDKLPHDTGNCVECICGDGAKITCSPHQCAPLGEEINDYRPPESRHTAQDSF
ncbi:uncharacterized protein LOC123317066 [Coccinella septempunctata]|uniref:uncharacterized protein LOC123317066 n=1 Tax=Coccinella septempunctata TaxID=41139 RepID=UPI001D06563C|nr:uncharacterized protein LOC123317066 [Coccinella septempunctata]